MTYCVGMLLDKGLVMAADTRTNAGVDNVGKFKKLYTWEYPGERVFGLLTAGNLAVTQAVVGVISEQIEHSGEDGQSLRSATTMFQAAHIIGDAIRHVKRTDGEHLSANGESFAASFIFGGQAAKMVLLSFDSTLRSNLSVGLPIDLLTYETGTLKVEHTKRIGPENPYFKMLSTEWSKALRTAFASIEALDI